MPTTIQGALLRFWIEPDRQYILCRSNVQLIGKKRRTEELRLLIVPLSEAIRETCDEPKNGDVTDPPIITLYLTSGQTDILAPIVPVAFYWEEYCEHVK